MPRADNRYSQFVTAAKIILPLAGLGLLSSLFLMNGLHGKMTNDRLTQYHIKQTQDRSDHDDCHGHGRNIHLH